MPTWPDLGSVGGSLLSALRRAHCWAHMAMFDGASCASLRVMRLKDGEQVGEETDRVLSGDRQLCAHRHTCSGKYQPVRS